MKQSTPRAERDATAVRYHSERNNNKHVYQMESRTFPIKHIECRSSLCLTGKIKTFAQWSDTIRSNSFPHVCFAVKVVISVRNAPPAAAALQLWLRSEIGLEEMTGFRVSARSNQMISCFLPSCNLLSVTFYHLPKNVSSV